MSDFTVVEHGAIFPQACLCGTQRGPLIDTRQEIGSTGMRHYICKLCAKQAAQLFGFASGEELDRLMDVRVQFEDYEQRLKTQEQEIAGKLLLITELERKVAALAEAKEAAEGEAEMLRHQADEMRRMARSFGADEPLPGVHTGDPVSSGFAGLPEKDQGFAGLPAEDQGTGHA